ncbi:MAG: GPW/gp25 family protein [Chloroflexi bacterium]|nr:GPW/gp25 family protein [Chloroflexota bacterium]
MAEGETGRAWQGTGWSFPPDFDWRSSSVTMVSEDEDIRQSLEILLSTVPGERVMNPSYGCGLKSLVFENISESTLTEIKDVIERAILFFEPRIQIDSIEVDVESIFDGLITIHLSYTIRLINTKSNMVYPFYFREGEGPIS